jgi:hypothetical protein
MTDITSKKVIVLKGILFLLIVIGSSMVILIKQPTLMAVLALCVLIWASARFYYFLFYVLERYVDPSLRYSGLLALLSALLQRRNSHRGTASNFDESAG